MYDTAPTIDRAAAEVLERHGPHVVPVLRELAERAVGLGDEMAAEEWRGIAEAAEHLVKEDAGG